MAKQRSLDVRRRLWTFVTHGRRITSRGISTGLELLYPSACAACAVELGTWQHDILLCDVCQKRFPANRSTLCPRCHDRRLYFDAVFSLGIYEGELRRALLEMKQVFGEPLSIAVGRLLYRKLGERLVRLEPDVVVPVPVPMHWSCRLIRGPNCPEVISEVLARRLRVPIARNLLIRRRKTLQQFSLQPTRRFDNIRGAFRAGAGYDLDAARVLLVDDILTTGATCSEAAKVLRSAGAARVMVAVVARA